MSRRRRGLAALVSVLAVCGPEASLAQMRGGTTATLHVHRRSGNGLQLHAVQELLESQLAGRPELRFRPIGQILEPSGLVKQQLQLARTRATEGRARLENLEVTEGVAAIEESTKLREQVFHEVSRTAAGVAELASTLGDLALAYFMADDRDRAQQALVQAFVLAPKQEFDTKKYPPQMRRLFEATRFLMDELGTGDARIITVPAGAEVRANGSLVGLSPVVARGLPATRCLVSVSQPGYRTQTKVLTVQAGKTVTETVRLEELPGRPAALLEGAVAEAVAGAASQRSAAAARLLRRQLVFLAQAERDRDSLQVQLFAYDAAAGRVVGRGQSRLSADSDGAAQALVASVMAMVLRPPERPTSKGPSWIARFHRSRYFWPVVGGVAGAALVATGVGLGVYYGTRPDTGDRDRRFVVLH